MAQRALIQVQAAREASGGLLLDYSLDSLRVLDDLIARYMPKLRTDPAEVAEVVGAYVGEVFRRRLGYRWCWQAGVVRLVGAEGRPVLDPVERARRRLVHGRRFSLRRYGEAVLRGEARPEEASDEPAWRRLFRT